MPMKKRRIAVLFGGRSPEHQVSLTSAVGVLRNIDRSLFDVIPVKITKQGQWQYLEALDVPDTVKDLQGRGMPAFLTDPTGGGLLVNKGGTFTVVTIDGVFPVLHGPFGEDGTVQGMIHMAGLPCVGAGVAGSALGMDKVLMKEIFLQEGLPAVDFIWFLRSKFSTNTKEITAAVHREIGFPCFVKPSNGGSSVGITKVNTEAGLAAAVKEAAQYDRKILVEKNIDGRELECAVLGNDDPQASAVGEILAANEFYDYDAKYENDASRTLTSPDIPETLKHTIQDLARQAFLALDCAGMARVDFLYDQSGKELYINEINTIPGFTPISMYPALWEASGVSYTELISRLIDLAFERFSDISRSKFVL